MSKLKLILARQMFYPGIIGIVINPFYHARKGLVDGVRKYAHYLKGQLLDVGCGAKPYQELFQTDSYIGMDTDSSGHDHKDEHIDVYFDGKHFPFGDATFDSILCNQVLEHVFEPQLMLSEIHRVLRPGGYCLLTVPFIWDEHEQPYDYARYSSFGLRYIFEKNGFKVIEQDKLTKDVSAIMQLLNAYIYKLTRPIPVVKQLSTLLIMCPINILGIILKLLPANPDFYLDNIVVARKMEE